MVEHVGGKDGAPHKQSTGYSFALLAYFLTRTAGAATEMSCITRKLCLKPMKFIVEITIQESPRVSFQVTSIPEQFHSPELRL